MNYSKSRPKMFEKERLWSIARQFLNVGDRLCEEEVERNSENRLLFQLWISPELLYQHVLENGL